MNYPRDLRAYFVMTRKSPLFVARCTENLPTNLWKYRQERDRRSPRSKSSTISGRRLAHQVFASLTFLPFLSVSGSGDWHMDSPSTRHSLATLWDLYFVDSLPGRSFGNLE